MPYLRSLSKAYSMFQHDEKQKEISTPILSLLTDSVTFTSLTGPINNHRGFNQRVRFDSKKTFGPSCSVTCKYCKNFGHTIDKCYRLHDFPLDFKFTKSRKFVACVQSESSDPSFGFLHPTPSDIAGHGFTKEQYQHLMTLLHQVHTSPISYPESIGVDNTGFANFAHV